MAYVMALLIFFQMVEIQHILFYGLDQTDSLQQMKILLTCYGAYIIALSDTTTTIYDTIFISEPLELFSFISADSLICNGDSTLATILVYGGTSHFNIHGLMEEQTTITILTLEIILLK